MLTIFTPTYNRAFILPKLYESLRGQTVMDFEWVIVDDGSEDETEALVRSWSDAPFPIHYHRQPNGGKHRAINAGVRMARGDFFFIVDSDDRLPADAVEVVRRECREIEEDKSLAGLIGLRGNFAGAPSGWLGKETFDGQIRDVRYRRRMMQDMAEVIRTEYLRAFPFPEIEGERFVTEALVWNRLDRRYRFRFLPEVIYLCEYLDDGLSAGYMRLLRQSPVAATQYYYELARDRELPLLTRLRSIVSLWRYYDLAESRPKLPLSWQLLRPIGRLLSHKDRRL